MHNYESDPKELARILFSQQPKNPNEIKLLPELYDTQDTLTDKDVVIYQFQILLNIYLEGILNILSTKSNDYAETYNNISMNDLLFVNPWFFSFGYMVNISEHEKYEDATQIYCRVLLSFVSNDSEYFRIKNITNTFHFIRQACFDVEKVNNVNDIYAVLNKNGKMLKIHFTKL